ncbi:MAG TPA: metallophosphoesterase [Chloroflexota bacterium]|nr:metallophosphoesterase [Chloroflexota bacterium]
MRRKHAARHGEVVVVHSSDLHLDASPGYAGREAGPAALRPLRQVLQTARAVGAQVVVLAGDVFEHNRQPAALLDQAAQLLAASALRVVILPGNHDPLTPDSVYRRGLAALANVWVLGLHVEQAVVFPELELEVWGNAHQDYGDMAPLREPRARTTRWQIATAHGHFQPEPLDPTRFYGSWLIREAELLATGADYVALGHWNRPARVGNGRVPAYYSGSPDLAGTVNVVRLSPQGVCVVREPLPPDDSAAP